MHNTKSHLIVASALLLLFATPACFADLMCYVCDNCQTVDKNTPLLACNEDFFNQGGSTEASTVTTTMSTMTTTDEPTTIMPTTETPTTMPSDSTTVMDTTTTEQPTTDTTAAQTTEKTDAPMPTPATVGPPETTTSVPTPPNEDLLREVTKLVAVNGSPSGLADFTELPIRQRRALIDTNVSFHCYIVKKTVNNTAQTERGCSRVLASQSVCTDLREQSAPLEISYCDPCSMNACNSATSMMHTTMLSTFLIVLVAVVLQRK